MREMQLLLMNGGTIHFTSREVRALFWGRKMVALGALLIAVVAIGNPVLFWTAPSTGARALLWTIALIVYLAIYPWWLTLCVRRWQAWFRMPLPQPLVTIIPVSVLTFLCGIAYQYTQGFPIGDSFNLPIWAFIRNICITLIAENIALFWLWPLSGSPLEPETETPPKDETPDPLFIQIGPAHLRVDEILCVKSDGHFLDIITIHGPQRLPARLKELTSQLSDNHGISPHRSHWVATQAVVRVSGAKLILKDGRYVPLSRGRRAQVIQWAHNKGISHS